VGEGERLAAVVTELEQVTALRASRSEYKGFGAAGIAPDDPYARPGGGDRRAYHEL
jgi:hypothetical protein